MAFTINKDSFFISLQTLETFDIISKVYDRGRIRWYREVLKLVRPLLRSPVLDAGCGTGYLLCEIASLGVEVVGVDYSAGMLKIAKKRCLKRGKRIFVHLIRASIYLLPLRRKAFKTCLAIAAIHHVESREKRISTLKQLSESVHGHLIVTAWYLFAPRNLLRWIKTRFSRDVIIPWKHNNRVLIRYYHLYTRREIKEDLERAGIKRYEILLWDYRKKLLKENIVVKAYVE